MVTRNKIFIIGAILALFLFALIFTVFRGGSPPAGPGTGEFGLPEYFLTADEEKRVFEFVRTFVVLYNTYTTEDMSNLPALGDYQTAEMQERTFFLVERLSESLSEGYSKETTVEEGSFQYQYPSGSTLAVTVRTRVTETGAGVYPAEARLMLKRSGDGWLVDMFEMNKK